MKTILLPLLLLFPLNLLCQEFSFPLYFEDAKGHKDTIVLGYDINATNGIDTAFGEKDIISKPWDSIFEVRITDGKDYSKFSTKKQIIYKNCLEAKPIYPLSILIRSTNYPFVIRWDSSIFSNNCKERSFITEAKPSGWLDALDKPLIYCNKHDSVLFHSITVKYQDSLGVVFMGFASNDDIMKTIAIRENLAITIRYNTVVEDLLIIETDDVIRTEVINELGQVLLSTYDHNISFSNFTPGIYLITVFKNNSRIVFDKIIKL